MTINPPTTPPTMGPIGVDFGGAVCPGKDPIFTHVVVAQEPQDSAVREQVSSDGQRGQTGGSGGHLRQRRNSRSGVELRDMVDTGCVEPWATG